MSKTIKLNLVLVDNTKQVLEKFKQQIKKVQESIKFEIKGFEVKGLKELKPEIKSIGDAGENSLKKILSRSLLLIPVMQLGYALIKNSQASLWGFLTASKMITKEKIKQVQGLYIWEQQKAGIAKKSMTFLTSAQAKNRIAGAKELQLLNNKKVITKYLRDSSIFSQKAIQKTVNYFVDRATTLKNLIWDTNYSLSNMYVVLTNMVQVAGKLFSSFAFFGYILPNIITFAKRLLGFTFAAKTPIQQITTAAQGIAGTLQQVEARVGGVFKLLGSIGIFLTGFFPPLLAMFPVFNYGIDLIARSGKRLYLTMFASMGSAKAELSLVFIIVKDFARQILPLFVKTLNPVFSALSKFLGNKRFLLFFKKTSVGMKTLMKSAKGFLMLGGLLQSLVD